MSEVKNKNIDLKSYFASILKQKLNARSRRKAKRKTGEILRKPLRELLQKSISPEMLESMLPYCKTILDFYKSLQGKKMFRNDGQAAAEKSAAVEEEHIHE